MARPLDKALFGYLTNYIGLERLIGSRLYPDLLPQNVTYPAVAYMLENERCELVQTGPCGLREAAYRFEAYGETADDVEEVAEQILDAMYSYTEGSPPVLPYLRVTENEGRRGRDEETLAFWREVRFTIWYRPT